MHRAFRRFPRTAVVLIGCDIPDAGPQDAVAALRALGKADATFGPAADGGYWLVAMSPRRPARPFARVRWSTRHALADTLVNFGKRRVALLRTLHDVDTVEDLRRVMRQDIHRSGTRKQGASRLGDDGALSPGTAWRCWRTPRNRVRPSDRL
jgi:glycosyltransferase A (GT-A) superfamily protein (DUF2064 family)